MTFDQFKDYITGLEKEFADYFNTVAPVVIGVVAVNYYKQNFQNEAWGREKWQEVQRRMPEKAAYKYNEKKHPARNSRKILTGDSGDLGRSIEVKEQNGERVIIWTNPGEFKDNTGSKEPYGRVHNEGLRAGRG